MRNTDETRTTDIEIATPSHKTMFVNPFLDLILVLFGNIVASKKEVSIVFIVSDYNSV